MTRKCVKGHEVAPDSNQCDFGDEYSSNLHPSKTCCLNHPLLANQAFCAFGHVDPLEQQQQQNPTQDTLGRQLTETLQQVLTRNSNQSNLNLKPPDFNVTDKISFKRWKS